MKVYNTRTPQFLLFFCSTTQYSVHSFQSDKRFYLSDRIRGPTRFGKAPNLIFPKLSSQNMRGFDHATILSPSFHGLRKERLAQWPAFCVLKYDQNFWGGYFQKNWEGVCGTLPETLTLFQTKICDFPYPISDLIKNLIPYFRPEALEPGAWPERVTSCYGTYTVVGVNIKREMVLSPNDEEVANSSKKHTQFKTRVHKPYPISDQNGRNWYPISDQNG